LTSRQRYNDVQASGDGAPMGDGLTVGHLSTSPFTASHCPARNISVPLSEIYCMYHVIDSTRYGRRAFAIADPSSWNSLSDPV